MLNCETNSAKQTVRLSGCGITSNEALVAYISEAWHGITGAQVRAFEKIDEALIKGILESHSKIPILALYLETAQIPIRYILACRRILYLQTILQRGTEELIYKVYAAQKMTQPKEISAS